MAYSAQAVANAFIDLAKSDDLIDLTPMKLQKLLYLAQAWHLKLKSAPLLDDNFSAWKYGPVIPSIYHEFKTYGYRHITNYATVQDWDIDSGEPCLLRPIIPAGDKDSWALIKRISEVYGKYSGSQLSDMTHASGTAWSTVEATGGVISHDAMKADILVNPGNN